MSHASGVPVGELPLALLSREGAQGQRLSWLATLARCHLGLSWTPQLGDGSVVLISGWGSYCAGTLGIMSRAAIRVKAELIEQGGVQFNGRSVMVDPGVSHARSVNRGICRILQQHIRDAGDSTRTDAVATAVLIALDLYLRGRHDAEGVTGEVRIDDLTATWKTDDRTITAALHRLESNRLLDFVKGRPCGRGKGSDPMTYRLCWPHAWRGLEQPKEPEAAPKVEQPTLSTPPLVGPTLDFTMRLAFAHPLRAHSAVASGLDVRIPSPQDGDTPAEVRIIQQKARIPPLPVRNLQSHGGGDAHAPVFVSGNAPPRPPVPPSIPGECAPQESLGEYDERGEKEITSAALPAFPPDHQEQMGIADDLWPMAQTILDGASAHDIRLALTPHIAYVLRGMKPETVIPAMIGHRIEDAWDLRVVLHRHKLRRDTRELWHDDIAATMSQGDEGLASLCRHDERARDEWLDVFARLGLRLSGVLAGLDHLFPRTELLANPSRYARHYATALQTWARREATSVHLVKRAVPAKSKVTGNTSTRTEPKATAVPVVIEGEVLPKEWWYRVLAVVFVPGSTGGPEDAAAFAGFGSFGHDPGIRLWLDTPKNRLIRRQNEVLLVTPTATFCRMIRDRYWARIKPAIELVCGPDIEARIVGPDGLEIAAVPVLSVQAS